MLFQDRWSIIRGHADYVHTNIARYGGACLLNNSLVHEAVVSEDSWSLIKSQTTYITHYSGPCLLEPPLGS